MPSDLTAVSPARFAGALLPLVLITAIAGTPVHALQVSVQISPDAAGQADPTVRLAGSTGNTLTFTVTNTGGQDTQFTRTCTVTGSVASVTCGAVGILIPGEVKTVTATFTAGGAGAGSITMVVTSTHPTGATATGKWNITVVNAISAEVTPDNASATPPANASVSYSFSVKNTSLSTQTFDMVPTCSGPGIVTAPACTAIPTTTNPLGQGGTQGITVFYATLAEGATGTIILQAKQGATVYDQGSVNVTVGPPVISASVIPDNASSSPLANSAVTYPFTIINNSSSRQAFTVVPTCSGSGIVTAPACTVSPTVTDSLAAFGGQQIANVSYSTLAAGATGTLILQAKQGSTVYDQGSVNVTVAPPVTASVTPDNASATPAANSNVSYTFTVTNTSGSPQVFSLVPTCTGSGVVTAPACTVSPTTTNNLPQGVSQDAIVSYSTLAAGATGTLVLQAKQGSTVLDQGSVNVTVASAPIVTASVTPDNASATPPANSSNTYTFTVTNTSAAPQIFTLVPTCSGAGIVAAPACTVNPTTTNSLPLNVSQNAIVTYSTLAVGATGTVILQAKQGSTVLDQGSVNVTVTAGGGGQVAPVMSLAGLNSGATIPRDECLTISLGGSAASECGDLRLVHGLPAVRTMNVTRAPILHYNSAQAEPAPNVAIAVTLPVGSTRPDTVEVLLKIGSAVYGRRVWPGSQWVTLGAPRIVRVRDTLTSSNLSQLLAYTVEVASIYNPPSAARLVVSGSQEVMIVNRRASPYGKGWWLAGLEQLDVATMVWIGGDGSARHYLPAGTGKWVSETVNRPDTLRLVSGRYVRYLPDSLKVWFSSTGRHDSTVNRLKQTTRFTYHGDGRLDSLVVPTQSQGTSRSYKLSYPGNTVQVQEGLGGSPRIATLYLSAGRLDSIADPDGTRVKFGYQSGASGVITSRTNRMQVARTFTVDSLRKVTRGFLSPGAGVAPIIDSLRPWQSLGLLTSVDTARAYTWWDAPRTDVVDTTTFRLTRWSAPSTIVNAIGGVTLLDRLDPNLPGVVTRSVAPNARVIRQTYDPMGRVLTVTDSGAVVRGAAAAVTTAYQWHQGCDLVTQVTPAEGLPVSLVYDGNTCNLLSETDGAGNQTTYTYWPFFLPATVQRPGIAGVDSLRYDPTLGNLSATRTPLLFLTTRLTDGSGRDSVVRTQMDPADPSVVQSQTLLYDVMGRLSQHTVNGPSRTYFSTIAGTNLVSPAMTVLTSNTYDLEGRLTLSLAQDVGGSVETRQLVNYDAAGRDTLQTLAGAATRKQYDEASNVTFTQKGGAGIAAVTIAYDALNRPIKRVMPSRDYPQACAPSAQCWRRAPIYPNNGTGLTLASDTTFLSYDNVGNLLSARNRWAKILRSYHPNGWLESDTAQYASVLGSGFSYSGLKYGLGFRYDGNGQRVALDHPGVIAPSVNRQSYTYNPATGALQTTVDLLGNTYGYLDDPAGRLRFLETTTSGGVNGVEQEWQYDSDSRVVRRSFRNRVSGSLGLLAGDTLSYDAQGRILQATTFGPASGASSAFQMRYDGMGGLLTSLTNYLGNARTEEYRRDALGNSLWEGSTGEAGFPVPFTSQYALNGRLQRREGVHPPVPSNCQTAYPDSLVQTHDPMGNIIKRIRAVYAGGFGGCGLAYNALDAEFHWYDTDNRLAVVQRDAGTPDRTTRSGTWEEYHYDPFGRRISVRERRDSLAAGTNLESALTTVVWDGQQMLYETRDPDGTGGPTNRYGTVGYIHGRDLDAPLAYTDGTLPVPDWRGLYQGSVFTAGPGADCATGGGGSPCVSIDWPAKNVGMSFRGWATGQGPTMDTWKGSLTTSMRDGTGLLYRRNRYYDPLTGRFTQLDPIGLAGGSNGYGFAGGDPVNYGDPFGLKVCFGRALRQTLVRATEQATGTSISLGQSGCIESITASNTTGRYTALRERLEYLNQDSDIYTVGFTGRDSYYNPSARRTGISIVAQFSYWTTGAGGRCNAVAVDRGYAGAVAHELLGHAYAREAQRIRNFFRPERTAITAENMFFAASGAPERCRY